MAGIGRTGSPLAAMICQSMDQYAPKESRYAFRCRRYSSGSLCGVLVDCRPGCGRCILVSHGQLRLDTTFALRYGVRSKAEVNCSPLYDLPTRSDCWQRHRLQVDPHATRIIHSVDVSTQDRCIQIPFGGNRPLSALVWLVGFGRWPITSSPVVKVHESGFTTLASMRYSVDCIQIQFKATAGKCGTYK